MSFFGFGKSNEERAEEYQRPHAIQIGETEFPAQFDEIVQFLNEIYELDGCNRALPLDYQSQDRQPLQQDLPSAD